MLARAGSVRCHGTNLNVKEQIKNILEKQKDVYEVKNVLVTQLGCNTNKPNIYKLSLENLKQKISNILEIHQDNWFASFS
jgi:hypothetical protein